MINYIGNAEFCLYEANELCYACFSPELDNFNETITVDDICFKVEIELDILTEGHLKEHAKESDYKWSVSRNNTWERKANDFLDRWSVEREYSGFR